MRISGKSIIRLLHGAGSVFCILATGGCMETVPDSPQSTVKRSNAMNAARSVQLGARGRQVGVGEGRSMASVYGDNSILVISPANYEDLAQGMMVAYRDRNGVQIVHRLVHKKSNGWVAAGTNNAARDPELVTPDNLIGVVYGVFSADNP